MKTELFFSSMNFVPYSTKKPLKVYMQMLIVNIFKDHLLRFSITDEETHYNFIIVL